MKLRRHPHPAKVCTICASSREVENVDGGKGQDNAGNTEPEHVSDIVPGDALAGASHGYRRVRSVILPGRSGLRSRVHGLSREFSAVSTTLMRLLFRSRGAALRRVTA